MVDPSKNTLEIASTPDYTLSGDWGPHNLPVFWVILLFSFLIYYLFLNNKLNLTNLLIIVPIFLVLLFICFIKLYIDTKLDRPTEKILINDTNIIISNRIVLNKWRKKIYPLDSIVNYSFQVNSDDENKLGLIRPSRKLDYISIFLYPSEWFWQNSKYQRLVLTGFDNKIIREIDLSYYYEQDIKKLIAFLQEKNKQVV